MSYRIIIGPRARRDLRDFADLLRDYSEDFAQEQLDRLLVTISTYLAETPLIWSHFFLTGAPYRGYLFRVGRRSHYWIIYTVDEEARIVEMLRFWNASRDPEAFEI